MPYRLPVYELLDTDDVDLTVFYTAERESNRHWDLPVSSVRSETLQSFVLNIGGRYVHFTRGVWRALRNADPEVVVTTGFNPPQLLAIAFCLAHEIPHVIQTDGTSESEARLTLLHRIIRRFVARRSSAFVAASTSGLDLVKTWGAPSSRLHRSVLAVDNERFAPDASAARDVDLLFSGQLTRVKNPLFAIAVARAVARRLGRRVRLSVLGDGPLRDQVEAAGREARGEVEVEVAGFQQQDSLPQWYGRARVFLFPTTWDPWGLVGNEAAAAGTPQIASPSAGSAKELVLEGEAGYVLPLDVEAWAARAAELLTDRAAWSRSSEAARRAVSRYTYQAAADGLRDALRQAADR